MLYLCIYILSKTNEEVVYKKIYNSHNEGETIVKVSANNAGLRSE